MSCLYLFGSIFFALLALLGGWVMVNLKDWNDEINSLDDEHTWVLDKHKKDNA